MMIRTGQGGAMVPDDVAAGEKSTPVLRTLADKVNWLIDRAHPAGRGPFSNNEVADLIKKATGEDVSYTTIWKLRNSRRTRSGKSRLPHLEQHRDVLVSQQQMCFDLTHIIDFLSGIGKNLIDHYVEVRFICNNVANM
jgi:hypothetical protein